MNSLPDRIFWNMVFWTIRYYKGGLFHFGAWALYSGLYTFVFLGLPLSGFGAIVTWTTALSILVCGILIRRTRVENKPLSELGFYVALAGMAAGFALTFSGLPYMQLWQIPVITTIFMSVVTHLTTEVDE